MIPYPQPLAQDSPARKPRGTVRHILLLLLSLSNLNAGSSGDDVRILTVLGLNLPSAPVELSVSGGLLHLMFERV